MSTKIVFMGSPDFAIPSLKALVEKFNVVGVVTQPDRRSGRGQKFTPPPVKELAESLGLEICQPGSLKDQDFRIKLKELDPDLIVVAAYGKILSKSILEYPKYGCINVHASLLPRWRGAAPINAAILHGDERSGITIMLMDEGMDTGDILSQAEIILDVDETAGTLFTKLSQLGADLLMETIPEYINGSIKPIHQDDSLATYAPMLKKEDGLIDFNKSAKQINQKVRAFNPWPGSFMKFDGKNLKIHSVRNIDGDQFKPGERFIFNNWPAVQTSDGATILEKVQMPGKKPVDGESFLRGIRSWESLK